MDNYTMDELILAFALKFENNAPVILQRLFEGTPVSVEEIDEILKKVEEKYVVITSDDYPDFFYRVDNPPFVFFYEGNLELFDQCDHYFEKTVDGRKCYLAINQKGNDVDWCIVKNIVWNSLNSKRKIKMNDKFTSDDILVALCKKFGNSTEIIDDVIDKNIFMTDKEKEYYLNEVHENYISFLSDDYPVILGGLDDPPVCLFYDGDLDVFQKDIHVYESVVNKADKIFIGIVNKGDEAEWCVATTDQEVLQPVVEEVFERNDNLEFKKYKQPQSAVLN